MVSWTFLCIRRREMCLQMMGLSFVVIDRGPYIWSLLVYYGYICMNYRDWLTFGKYNYIIYSLTITSSAVNGVYMSDSRPSLLAASTTLLSYSTLGRFSKVMRQVCQACSARMPFWTGSQHVVLTALGIELRVDASQNEAPLEYIHTYPHIPPLISPPPFLQS